MTKKELLAKILEINENLDNLQSTLKAAVNDVKDIQSLIDDIPDEESEITDKEEEE